MHHPTPLTRCLAASFACWLTLAPSSAKALGLGELVVRSHLGQPLRAQLPVKTGPDENIDESCVSLARPGNTQDGVPYLMKARIAVESAAGGQMLRIHSSQVINEPVFRLFLQITCGGQANLGREFTVLLDPQGYGAAPPLVEDALPAGKQAEDRPAPIQGTTWEIKPGDTLSSIAHAIYPDSRKMRRKLGEAIVAANPHLFQEGAQKELPVGENLRIPELSVPKRHAPAVAPTIPDAAEESVPTPKKPAHRPAAVQPARTETFQLKLSTGDIDLSASRNMSEEDRLKLREKQLLLEADDQVANILALKNRVKQLETQLNDLSLKMSAGVNQAPPAKPTQVEHKPAAAAPLALPHSFWAILGGLAASLGLFFAARRYRQRKEALEALEQFHLDDAYAAEETESAPARPISAPHAAKPADAAKHAADETYYDPSSIFVPPEEKITLTEMESVIEEADLYLIYGWTQKAIELLQGHIEKHPQEIQPWMMLFDIYRSQGMKEALEKLARRFKESFDDEAQWRKVQHLGREADPKNPLYFSADGNGGESASTQGNGNPDDTPAQPAKDHSQDYWAQSRSDFSPNFSNRHKPLQSEPQPGEPLPRILDFERKDKQDKH